MSAKEHRPIDMIRMEIAAVQALLKRLKHEHMCACSSARMRKLRRNPEFLRKREEGSKRAETRPELRALRQAQLSKVGQPLRLPDMTDSQYRLYYKLRWRAARMSRADALAEVLRAG